MKKVKDVMVAEALKHCTLETKLQDVAKIMKEANHGALPIVDKTDKVLGMITDRDVCLSLAAQKEKDLSTLSVKDAVSNLKVHTVNADDNVSKALQEMRKNKIGRLPVTDKEGKLRGILSVNGLLADSLSRKEDLGHITSDEENIARTMKALLDRNSKRTKKEREKLEL